VTAQLTCSWCGQKREATMPLCRRCNPNADRILVILEQADRERAAG